MVYETTSPGDGLRQGDIFFPLPKFSAELTSVLRVRDDGRAEETRWSEISEDEENVLAIPVEPTIGIVATQDCDASRAASIAFFCVDNFSNVTKQKLGDKPKRQVENLIKHSRANQKWFYLPPGKQFGLSDARMAIDFGEVISIARCDIEENLAELRKCRLNTVAYEHYRESIAQYYRRYPYDEWYPLNKEEFEAYRETKEDVTPFPYQE
jgi:hypothetical protein